MPPNSTYIAPDNVNPLKYVQSEPFYLESTVVLGQGEHGFYIGQLLVCSYTRNVVPLLRQVVHCTQGKVHL